MTITSNATNEPTKMIRIKGRVEGETGTNGSPEGARRRRAYQRQEVKLSRSDASKVQTTWAPFCYPVITTH